MGRLVENCHYAWSYFWSGHNYVIAFGILFALLAIALLIASRTRWGKTKPLTKCIVVSVVAHIWLLIYACGSQIVLPQGDPDGAMHTQAVSIDAIALEPSGPSAALNDPDLSPDDAEATHTSSSAEQPAWNRPLDANRLPHPDLFDQVDPIESSLVATLPAFEPAELPSLPEPPIAVASTLELAETNLESTSARPPTVDVPTPPPGDPEPSVLPPAAAKIEAHTVASSDYQLRQMSNRLELARPFGADQDSEASVAAALAWLARAQSADGAWISQQHGGGTETYALRENRHGTGDRADTGITGLALLAFLSGGHTHLAGDHRATVERGLVSLIRSQMPSGDLSGPKQTGNDASVTNARMYCHGIAMLALAEAYAMTHDVGLREPLTRAVVYTRDAQDPRGGGWRYRPGDAGDLSQFGWQALALRSAERSGIGVEPVVKQRMRHFVETCLTGQHRGLARYRPFEGEASTTMTAEALTCRLLYQYPVDAAARNEARNYLLGHLPGVGEDNVYYWYYATLALFQLQDDSWQRWNQAMKSKLISSQKPAYDVQAGSWDPDRLWGGYGGRVYSTAMSCLCLEVYYRYLPLYQSR